MAISAERDDLKIWFGDELSDKELVIVRAWLNGELQKRPNDELKARRALSRAVLGGAPLPKDVRLLLSERFDPNDGGIGFVLKPTRTRGRPKVKPEDWQIAVTVGRRI